MCLYFCTGDFIFNLSCKPLVPGLLLFLIPSLRMRDLIIDIPRSCVYYCANRSCGLRPSGIKAENPHLVAVPGVFAGRSPIARLCAPLPSAPQH